jgi:hypothetical protein
LPRRAISRRCARRRRRPRGCDDVAFREHERRAIDADAELQRSITFADMVTWVDAPVTV